MDLSTILRDLKAQREKLVETIATMEAIMHADGTSLSNVPAKRRGRKFMGEEERREVSKRMHRYWESRHKATTGANDYRHVLELNASQRHR
jgi:hypothetical protein